MFRHDAGSSLYNNELSSGLMGDTIVFGDGFDGGNNIKIVTGDDALITLNFFDGRKVQICLDKNKNNHYRISESNVNECTFYASGDITIADIIKGLVQLDSRSDVETVERRIRQKKIQYFNHTVIEFTYYKLFADDSVGCALRDEDLAPGTVYVIPDNKCIVGLNFLKAANSMNNSLWDNELTARFYHLLKSSIDNCRKNSGGVNISKCIIIDCSLDEVVHTSDLRIVMERYIPLDFIYVKELNVLVTVATYNAADNDDYKYIKQYLEDKGVLFKIKFVFDATDFWSAIKSHRRFASQAPEPFSSANFEVCPAKDNIVRIGSLSYVSPTGIILKQSDLLGCDVHVNDLLHLIDLHNKHIWNVTDIHLAVHWLYGLLLDRSHGFENTLRNKMIGLPNINKRGIVYMKNNGGCFYIAEINKAASNFSDYYVSPSCNNLSINYKVIMVLNLFVISSIGFINYAVINKAYVNASSARGTKSFSLAFVVVLFSLFCLYKCIKSLYLSCRFIFAKKIGCSNINECLGIINERLGNGLGRGSGNDLDGSLGVARAVSPGGERQLMLDSSCCGFFSSWRQEPNFPSLEWLPVNNLNPVQTSL